MRRKHGENRLAEHVTSNLKTYNVVVKSIHLDPENPIYSDFDHDFTPFLPYSLNKKKRWMTEIGVDLLENIRDCENDVHGIVVERVQVGPYNWPHDYEYTLSEQFQIQTVHFLSENEGYQKKFLKSKLGLPFKNFQLEDRVQKSTVAYNYLKPPKNYEKLFAKQCISKKDNDWPYTSGWLRKKRRADIDFELRHHRFEPEEHYEYL